MKARRYTGVAVLILMIVVILLLFTDRWGSFQRESRRIVIGDRTRIDQIVIAGPADTVTLTRSGDAWRLPGEESVNPVAVENLLFTAERLRVDAVHTGLAVWNNGTLRKVSFIRGDRTVLQYETESRDGRLLLRLPNSERVFSVSLPGYPELDLNLVFSDSVNHFREHMLIDLFPLEIRQIEVEKRGYPAFRFFRDKSDSIICELPGLDSVVPMELLDKVEVRMLFTYFTSIRYEEKVSDLPYLPESREMKDRWMARVVVESGQGEKHILQVYSLPGEHGEKEDMFRALVFYNNSAEPLVVNYIYLDVLMRDLSSYFGDNRLRH